MLYAFFYMALPNLGPNPANARTVETIIFQKFHLIASVLPFSFAMKNLFFVKKMYFKIVLGPFLHGPAKFGA